MAGNSRMIAAYVQSEAAKVDSTFGVRSTFDDQRALFVNKRPIYDLQNAFTQYQRLDCRPKLKFDPGHCSWRDVYDQLSETQEVYEAKAKGVRGFARKIYRKVGENADAIEPALGLIPDTSGLSIVAASLGWMLLLAKESATKREAIFGAFREIPGIIEMAEEDIKRFPSDVQLKDLTNELYDTVLSGVSKMIQWLLPRHITKAIKIFDVRETPSGDEIDTMLATVQRTTEAFKQRTEQLMRNVHVSTHRRVEQSYREAKAIRSNTVAVGQQLSQVEETLGPLPHKIDGLREDLGDLRDKISRLELASVDGLASLANHGGLVAQNWMYRQLSEMLGRIQADVEAKFQAIEDRERTRRLVEYSYSEAEAGRTTGRGSRPPALAATSSSPSSSSASLSAAEVLLDILRVPAEVITADLGLVIRHGLQSGYAGDAQARWLLRQDRFWTWFTSATSDLVVVEGLPSSAAAAGGTMMMMPDPVSPLSFVCANVVASVIRDAVPDAVPVYHFCGLHAASGADLRGPRGLLRSITAKLLLELRTRYPAEAAGLDLAAISATTTTTAGVSSVDALRRYDVESLCSLFRHVVARFPPRAVIYCVLDGIFYYEKPEMIGGASLLVRHLVDLVESSPSTAGGPVFRILLATPCPARRITSRLPMHRRILLRAGLLADDGLSGRVGFMNFRFPSRQLPARTPVGVGGRGAPVLSSQEEWTADDYT